jgi:menaquinone-9 beta-reductase
MNNTGPVYDVAIIGGGLAGLALSIQLASQGRSVVLVEKETYPFHKVCGEYISLESWNFLTSLGLPLGALHLPIIDTLLLTSAGGKSFTTRLPLGGFGMSRYALDAALAQLAAQKGVDVLQETKAEEVSFNDLFHIRLSAGKEASARTLQAKVCCAAYGKRSNLDVKWKRGFLFRGDRKLENYIGVKYHIRSEWKDNIIGLHNFREGYCGISKIEGDNYCLCYMTKADELKKSGNQIRQLEERVLFQNPFLKSILTNSVRSEAFPITISQISFSKKTQVENGVLMLGDAAGMIAPLCGNGMSMALHSSKLATQLVNQFLDGTISRKEMEARYRRQWQAQFAGRLLMGRTIQRFFGKGRTTDWFISMFKAFPFLAKPVVKLTHGRPF